MCLSTAGASLLVLVGVLLGSGIGAAGCRSAERDYCRSAAGSREERVARADSRMLAVVALRNPARPSFLCSGVLVDRRKVLTAAHCMHEGWHYRVHFGADLLLYGAAVEASAWHLHPSLDLALLVLDADAPPAITPVGRWSGAPMPDRSYLRVTGYGGPADSISRCLRVSDGVADIGLDPFRSDQSRFAVLLDGIWYPGDSGSPMTVFKGDEPILLGISTDYVSGETAFGTLIFVVRLRPDDPWLLEQMPTPPEELP